MGLKLLVRRLELLVHHLDLRVCRLELRLHHLDLHVRRLELRVRIPELLFNPGRFEHRRIACGRRFGAPRLSRSQSLLQAAAIGVELRGLMAQDVCRASASDCSTSATPERSCPSSRSRDRRSGLAVRR